MESAEQTEQAGQDARPAAPEFLLRSVNRAKVEGNKALQTGKPIGEVVELICNTLIEAIGEEGYGFAHNSFAATFMAQAKDAGLMRQALAAIMVKVETEGQFTDASAVKQVLESLTPLPS